MRDTQVAPLGRYAVIVGGGVPLRERKQPSYGDLHISDLLVRTHGRLGHEALRGMTGRLRVLTRVTVLPTSRGPDSGDSCLALPSPRTGVERRPRKGVTETSGEAITDRLCRCALGLR